MNKIFVKIIAISLSVISLTAFAGCNDSSSQTETTTPKVTEETSIKPDSDTTVDIKTLNCFDAENGDDLAGAWRIKSGEGEQFKTFVYMFDGHGKVTLAIDNMGYLENYTLDSNKKTVSLMVGFGLNGTYKYELSDDKKSLMLTNEENKLTTTMENVENFSMIPDTVEKPQIDESILGAWKSDDGEYIYFDADGIMYNNLYGKTLIYSNYSAVDSTITSNYVMQSEELSDTYIYTVKDDVLTLNNATYNKIPASELV